LKGGIAAPPSDEDASAPCNDLVNEGRLVPVVPLEASDGGPPTELRGGTIEEGLYELVGAVDHKVGATALPHVGSAPVRGDGRSTHSR
jgi:hypothetical protein